MRGLIYTALVIAFAGICANAEPNGAIDEQTNNVLKMCKCVCMTHEATAMVSSLQAYDNLNNGMGAEELYETHCAGLVDVPKCFSNCNKGHKVSQSMEKEDKALLAPSILPGVEIVKKNCFKIREIFSNRKPVFDCAKKIYPLIAKSEENAKCRKMCCSEPNDKAGLYACSVREGYRQWVTTDYASSAEDMCQFACVIDQAAKYSYNLCSSDLTKMLEIAHQDVLKIYKTMKKFT